MVLQSIIISFLAITQWLVELFPDIGNVPNEIVTASTWIIGTVRDAQGLLAMIYTAPLLAAIVMVMISLFSFETVSNSLMWVYRRLRN